MFTRKDRVRSLPKRIKVDWREILVCVAFGVAIGSFLLFTLDFGAETDGSKSCTYVTMYNTCVLLEDGLTEPTKEQMDVAQTVFLQNMWLYDKNLTPTKVINVMNDATILWVRSIISCNIKGKNQWCLGTHRGHFMRVVKTSTISKSALMHEMQHDIDTNVYGIEDIDHIRDKWWVYMNNILNRALEAKGL